MKPDESITVERAQHLCDTVAMQFDAIATQLLQAGGTPFNRDPVPTIFGMSREESLEVCLRFAKRTNELTDAMQIKIQRLRKKYIRKKFRISKDET